MTVSIPTADHHAPAGRGDARAAVWWLAGALLLAGGLGVGAVVSDMGASRTGELGLDVSLSHHRDALLTWLADAVTVVLGPVVAPLLLVALTALVWRRHRPAAITLCAATVVGWLSVGVGKLLFQRARPLTTRSTPSRWRRDPTVSRVGTPRSRSRCSSAWSSRYGWPAGPRVTLG